MKPLVGLTFSLAIAGTAMICGCGSFDLGAVAGFFTPGVTIEVENATDFPAEAVLTTSDASNIAADVVAQQDAVTGLGAIQPHQTTTVRLDCNDNLERVYFKKAAFKLGNGFSLGDVSSDTKLRRDIDFDCGAVIHIRLSGSLLSFKAAVSVDNSSSSSNPLNASGGSGSSGDSNSSTDESVRQLLDRLFG